MITLVDRMVILISGQRYSISGSCATRWMVAFGQRNGLMDGCFRDNAMDGFFSGQRDGWMVAFRTTRWMVVFGTTRWMDGLISGNGGSI